MIYKNQTMKSIKAYLTEPAPKETAQTNEVIGVLLCTSLLAFCSKPLFETEGMKSLLGGIGSMFAGFGSIFSRNKGEMKDDDLKTLKDLISKDPDDLSPKEKKQLKEFEQKYNLSEILSPNDMKKFDNAMGRGEKGDEPSDKETKELKDLLKKKDEDLSPKEKKRLQELKGKYDWSEYLSDKDFSKLTGKEPESTSEPKDKGKSKDEGKSKSTDTEKDGSSLLLASLALARESNSKEKDEVLKKKNEAMIDLLTACSFDKDGNEIPLDQRMDKMKDMMSPEQFESFKKEMTETYEKVKDDQKFLDALTKAKENIKPEDYDKMVEDAKSKAKTTLEKVEKEKKAYEDYEKKLNDLEEQAKKADEEKKKELEQQKKELEQNPPQSMMSTATGVNNDGSSVKNDKDTDSEDEVKAKSEQAKTEFEKQAKKAKEDFEKQVEAANGKKKEEIENEYKEQSSKLEKEYQEKIDKEKDPDKKKKLEDEWADEEMKLSAKKNKDLDSIDDKDEHDTEKDETKKGKYKVKEEEVKDPKTGKKIKVKTYTGPRGGKFYYPDGKSKTPENKVYVESLSLTDYLYESMC